MIINVSAYCYQYYRVILWCSGGNHLASDVQYYRGSLLNGLRKTKNFNRRPSRRSRRARPARDVYSSLPSSLQKLFHSRIRQSRWMMMMRRSRNPYPPLFVNSCVRVCRNIVHVSEFSPCNPSVAVFGELHQVYRDYYNMCTPCKGHLHRSASAAAKPFTWSVFHSKPNDFLPCVMKYDRWQYVGPPLEFSKIAPKVRIIYINTRSMTYIFSCQMRNIRSWSSKRKSIDFPISSIAYIIN